MKQRQQFKRLTKAVHVRMQSLLAINAIFGAELRAASEIPDRPDEPNKGDKYNAGELNS